MELDAPFVPTVRDDDGNVTYIKGGRGDIEDSNDGKGAADADEVQARAESYDEPDGVDGRVCQGIDFGPEPITPLTLT